MTETARCGVYVDVENYFHELTHTPKTHAEQHHPPPHPDTAKKLCDQRLDDLLAWAQQQSGADRAQVKVWMFGKKWDKSVAALMHRSDVDFRPSPLGPNAADLRMLSELFFQAAKPHAYWVVVTADLDVLRGVQLLEKYLSNSHERGPGAGDPPTVLVVSHLRGTAKRFRTKYSRFEWPMEVRGNLTKAAVHHVSETVSSLAEPVIDDPQPATDAPSPSSSAELDPTGSAPSARAVSRRRRNRRATRESMTLPTED